MIRCCKRRYLRLIAKPLLLVFAFSLSIFPPGGQFATPQAHAQLNLQRMVVLDFSTASGIDPMLGKKAADALAVELTATGKFEVIPRDQIAQEVRAQGLSSPLDLVAQMKVATKLEASSVMSGKIFASHVTTSPSRVRVELSVVQTDVVSGEPVNGSRTVGDTGAKLGSVDPGVMLDEAVSKAAYGAVKSMLVTKLPLGIVEILDNHGQITLNIGARDGVVRNMRMSVTRDEWDADKKKIIPRKIGDISVIDVEPAHSTAVASSAGMGIQTADRVRAIFEIPSSPVIAGQSPIVGSAKSKGVKGIGGSISALLAPLFALALFMGGAGGNPTAQAPSGETARAGSEGSTVIVNWGSDPRVLDPKSIVGYVIYRNTTPSFGLSNIIDFTQQSGVYIDNTEDFQADVTIDVDSTTGQPTITYTKTLNPTRQSTTNTTLDIRADHPPIRPGVTYYYAIRRVGVQQPQSLPNGGGGTGTTGGSSGSGTTQGFAVVETDFSPPTGGATPLSQALLISPPSFPNPGSDAIDLNNITFTFQTVDSGDLFQVQVSDSSSFPVSRRYESPVKQFAGAPGGTMVTFTPPSGGIAGALPGLAGGAQLFWRVGWRNSRDALTPASVVSANDSGFVFSQTFSFKTAEGPPPPPRAQTARERLKTRVKTFVEGLTPEQQKKFKELLVRQAKARAKQGGATK